MPIENRPRVLAPWGEACTRYTHVHLGRIGESVPVEERH